MYIITAFLHLSTALLPQPTTVQDKISTESTSTLPLHQTPLNQVTHHKYRKHVRLGLVFLILLHTALFSKFVETSADNSSPFQMMLKMLISRSTSRTAGTRTQTTRESYPTSWSPVPPPSRASSCTRTSNARKVRLSTAISRFHKYCPYLVHIESMTDCSQARWSTMHSPRKSLRVLSAVRWTNSPRLTA